MIGPPPMFYDGQGGMGSQPPHASYQPWVNPYDQSQFDYTRANNVLPNSSFNPQSHLHPHPHAAGSAPILDMASSTLQPPNQNQYSYAPQGHYIQSLSTHDTAYDQQQYVQPRTIARQQEQPQPMAQRIPRQVQQQHAQQSVSAASRGDYSGTQHQHHPIPQQQQLPTAPNVYEYQQQQAQHQPSYVPPTTDGRHYAQTITPEPPMEPNEVQQQQQQQQLPQGSFTFWMPPQSEVPQANMANSAPSSTYAPSPDPASTIPHSVSSSSWGGTDDGRSRSQPSGQSVSPQPPSSSTLAPPPATGNMNSATTFRVFQQPRNQSTGKRERGRPKATTRVSPKKRRRNDPDVESDSGSEEDEPQEAGSSTAVPPLRGTTGTFIRLYVVRSLSACLCSYHLSSVSFHLFAFFSIPSYQSGNPNLLWYESERHAATKPWIPVMGTIPCYDPTI